MAASFLSRPVAGALAWAMLSALAGCGRASDPAPVIDSTPVVTVVTVAPAQAPGALSISGLVAFKRETPLSFDAPGTVTSIDVDVGDTVAGGQRLAGLRRATVGTNAAEAAMARETAERQLARVQALHDQGFASQAALDDARLAVEHARDQSVLVAPSAGIVLRREVEPAQTVAAGQAVMIIGEPAFGMVVRASASALDATRLAVGQTANVNIAGMGARAGTITRMAPKSDDATGAFEIEIRLSDMTGLRSGEVAAVTIAAGAAQAQAPPPQLLIPTLALLDARADQGVVYVVDSLDKAHRRTIQTGGLIGDNVIVLSGLAAGERIVGEGAAYVRDGEPVRPAKPPNG
jgi:RND family efflux transporter MFP subunit